MELPKKQTADGKHALDKGVQALGTQYENSQENLLVSEHYRFLIENSDDAIISKTLDGIVTSWNPAAERLFGYLADEMVGQSLRFLFPPERLVQLRKP